MREKKLLKGSVLNRSCVGHLISQILHDNHIRKESHSITHKHQSVALRFEQLQINWLSPWFFLRVWRQNWPPRLVNCNLRFHPELWYIGIAWNMVENVCEPVKLTSCGHFLQQQLVLVDELTSAIKNFRTELERSWYSFWRRSFFV